MPSFTAQGPTGAGAFFVEGALENTLGKIFLVIVAVQGAKKVIKLTYQLVQANIQLNNELDREFQLAELRNQAIFGDGQQVTQEYIVVGGDPEGNYETPPMWAIDP
jgi:hypothetical protein